MSKSMTVTALRRSLYRVVDQVLETGVPVEIDRNGSKVVISPAKPSGDRLARLKKRDVIVGDPDDLVDLEVTEWHEPSNLH